MYDFAKQAGEPFEKYQISNNLSRKIEGVILRE